MTAIGVSMLIALWLFLILSGYRVFYFKRNSLQQFPTLFELILLVVTFILLDLSIHLTVPAIFSNLGIINGLLDIIIYLLKWSIFITLCLYRKKRERTEFSVKKINLTWLILSMSLGSLIAYPIFSIDTYITSHFDLPILPTTNYSVEIKLIKGLIFTPIFEEILFRGIILSSSLQRMKAINAIVFSSLLFTAVHSNLNFALGTFIFGILLGMLFAKTKSIYSSIAAHAAFNLVSFLIY